MNVMRAIVCVDLVRMRQEEGLTSFLPRTEQ